MGTSKGTQLIDPAIRKQMAEALEVSHISDKTALILDMVSKGHSIDIAHRMVTGKDKLSDSTKTHLKKKSQKWLLSSPDLQKLAHHAVRDTLKMKPIKVKVSPYGDEDTYIYPQVSNRLAAAAMVTDRTEPVKQDHGPQSVTNNIQVNVRELFSTQHVVLEDNGQKGIDE